MPGVQGGSMTESERDFFEKSMKLARRAALLEAAKVVEAEASEQDDDEEAYQLACENIATRLQRMAWEPEA